MSDAKKFDAHLFICTYAREKGANCASRGGQALRDLVKARCKEASGGLGQLKIRVNAAGCLDQCDRGIAAVLYPQGEWFTGLKPDDSQILIIALDRALADKKIRET